MRGTRRSSGRSEKSKWTERRRRRPARKKIRIVRPRRTRGTRSMSAPLALANRVEEGVAEQRREDAEHERQRHRMAAALSASKSVAAKPSPSIRSDTDCPLARRTPSSPGAISVSQLIVADVHRVVQAQTFPQEPPYGLGRGGLAEDLLQRNPPGRSSVPRKDDQARPRTSVTDAQPQTLRDHDPDMWDMSPLGPLCQVFGPGRGFGVLLATMRRGPAACKKTPGRRPPGGGSGMSDQEANHQRSLIR